MSWTLDNSARLTSSGDEVRLVSEERGDKKCNAMWICPTQSGDCLTVWRVQVTGGGGMWVGVATEDRFGPGYGLKGLLYGGPGNLSDGGSLVQSRWGPALGLGDTLHMRLSVEEGRVRLDYGRNGINLGTAFDITGWSGAPLRPVVSLSGQGDSLTIAQVEAAEFPDKKEEDGGEVSGDWESEDGTYQLTVAGDERLCKLSARVANTLICSLKYNDQRSRWGLEGGIISTQMMPPPHLQALETSVIKILESITDISLVGNQLVVTSEGGSHRFNRAARPAPATKDRIRWIK